MSKHAQAERERQASVTLGTAELEIAEKFEEAVCVTKIIPSLYSCEV
jgi:hypothetical protein